MSFDRGVCSVCVLGGRYGITIFSRCFQMWLTNTSVDYLPLPLMISGHCDDVEFVSRGFQCFLSSFISRVRFVSFCIGNVKCFSSESSRDGYVVRRI